MTWNELPQHVRTTATRVLTPKELDAWKLSLDGAGYRRIALALGISIDTTRGRLDRARRKLDQALTEQETMMTTIPYDPETGTLTVPVRVSPEWLAALKTGVACAGVTLIQGDHGDYDIHLHKPPTTDTPADEEKPNRATRRRTSRSKAA